jgi:hypothetical protein
VNIAAAVAAHTVIEKEREKRGNPIDPCEEARRTLRLYEDDIKAGHTEAAQYWLGEASAFGVMCTLGSLGSNNPDKEGNMGEGKCAPDDIKCQAENLRTLRDFRKTLDDPKFRESHPSLAELAPQIDQVIKEENESFIENLGQCILPEAAEPAEEGINEQP